MTPRAEFVKKAREIVHGQDLFDCFILGKDQHNHGCEVLTWCIALALEAVERETVERAAKIADNAREDEEYGHAAFRCVQIAQEIRALLPQPEEKK